MAQALTYFYSIFNGLVDFVFNRMLIFENVSIGWVCVACLVFILIVRSLLNLPRSFTSIDLLNISGRYDKK